MGKYTGLHDSYISIFESLFHGGIANGARVQLVKFESEELEDERDLEAAFARVRRHPGAREASACGASKGRSGPSDYAREKKIPYLGICLGMQIAAIEFARVARPEGRATSTEFDPETPLSGGDLLEEQVDITAYGGTMRLGARRPHLHEGTRTHAAYGAR